MPNTKVVTIRSNKEFLALLNNKAHSPKLKRTLHACFVFMNGGEEYLTGAGESQ